MAKRFIGGELVSSVAPAGSIQAFAGASVPDGWLLCDGSVKNISEFPALAAALDGTWDSFAHPVDGTPSVGAGQFAVPNMKGLYLSGAGNAGGDARSLGVFQSDATKPNGLSTSTNTAMSFRIFSAGSGSTYKMPITSTGSKANVSNSYADGQITGGNHTHPMTGDNETRPKTAPVNYIIKY